VLSPRTDPAPRMLATFSQAQTDDVVRQFMPLVRQISQALQPVLSRQSGGSGSSRLNWAAQSDQYYDPTRARSASFKTLATCYIRGEIRHYLRDHCSIVQVPRKLTEMNAHLSQLEERLDKGPRSPADSEGVGRYDRLFRSRSAGCAAVLGSSRFTTNLLIRQAKRGRTRRSAQLVGARARQKISRHDSLHEDRELISQALKRLGERTREIVEFVFFYDLSQKETASVLGLSEMGVSRAIHSALRKLERLTHNRGKVTAESEWHSCAGELTPGVLELIIDCGLGKRCFPTFI